MKISDGMILKLDKIETRFNEIGNMLSDTSIINNQQKFKELSKEHSDLMPIVDIYTLFKKHKQEFDDCEEMLSLENDQDLRSMIKQELDDFLAAL